MDTKANDHLTVTERVVTDKTKHSLHTGVEPLLLPPDSPPKLFTTTNQPKASLLLTSRFHERWKKNF